MDAVRNAVEKEFPGFTPVSSIADCLDYDLCDVLFVEVKRSTHTLTYWIPYLGFLFNTTETSLQHVGSLKHKTTTKNQANIIEKLIGQAEVKEVTHLDRFQIKSSNSEGAVKGTVVDGQAKCTFGSDEVLNLGLITKKSLHYEDIVEDLKKLSTFSKEFIRLAKERHLVLIYEVLYAQQLIIKQSESANSSTNGGIRVPLATINQNVSISASRNNTEIQYSTLKRTKEMGLFPIAYKCGNVRLVDDGSGKKMILKLRRMHKFHKAFDPTDEKWQKPTSDQFESPPSSQEIDT